MTKRGHGPAMTTDAAAARSAGCAATPGSPATTRSRCSTGSRFASAGLDGQPAGRPAGDRDRELGQRAEPVQPAAARAGRRGAARRTRGGRRSRRGVRVDLARRGPDEAERHAVPQPARHRDRGDDPGQPAGRDRHPRQLRQDACRARSWAPSARTSPPWWSPAAPARLPSSGASGSAPAPRCGGCGTSAAPAGSATTAGGRWSACLNCGTGACNTMGTASTMALLTEALGLMIPGSSTIPAGDPRAPAAAAEAGRRAVAARHRRPGARRRSCTPAAFGNAIRVLHAIGGSTNAVIHLAAIAGRVGVDAAAGRARPARRRRCRCSPTSSRPGTASCRTSTPAGGVPALLRELSGLLDGDAGTVAGLTIGEIAGRRARPPAARSGRWTARCAPTGRSRWSAARWRPTARSSRPPRRPRACCATAARRWSSTATRTCAAGSTTRRCPSPPDSVLVLAGLRAGRRRGMPEWGMIPIPASSPPAGVTDMVRVTDARMSGTSFGTVFLHAAPEAAVGGPLGPGQPTGT